MSTTTAERSIERDAKRLRLVACVMLAEFAIAGGMDRAVIEATGSAALYATTKITSPELYANVMRQAAAILQALDREETENGQDSAI